MVMYHILALLCTVGTTVPQTSLQKFAIFREEPFLFRPCDRTHVVCLQQS